MRVRYLLYFLALFILSGCVGATSSGLFGTGVTIAMDPRSLGTQIDDSIMDKSIDARLITKKKNYLINVKTRVIDGRIFLSGKVEEPEEKIKITKMAWETKGVRSVKNAISIKGQSNFKSTAKDILITSQLRSALIFNKKTLADAHMNDQYNGKTKVGALSPTGIRHCKPMCRFDKIRMWANDRGLYSAGDTKTQTLKLMEEAGEICRAVLKKDEPEIIDGIGDCVVVLTNLAHLCGTSIEKLNLIHI